jgi:hypothetical protein
MEIRDLELFDVDQLLSYEGNFMQQGVGLAQVKLVLVADLVVFEDSAQVPLPELVRDHEP